MLKIFKGFDDINYQKIFSLSSTELRGHDFKLYKPQVNLDVRKYFFSNRVIIHAEHVVHSAWILF